MTKKSTKGKICFINLGCKVNKYENDCMAKMCENAGYTIVDKNDSPDYFVINSCAVTNESEKKSRQYVSKLHKLSSNAKIVVVGCASQHNPEQFANKPNVICVSGNAKKGDILKYLKGGKGNFDVPNIYDGPSDPYITHTRAYLKVQDGCNNFCTYCIIPYIRGRSRSRDIGEVVAEATALSEFYPEIVVTGIDLSSYKIDGKLALGELLYRLKDLPARIRIGSLEVNVITDEFLSKISKMPNLAPQFHLSLQSGSDTVLKKMNRHYTTKEYLQKVKLIRKYFPDANITTDVIVGFCNEGEKEFRQTIKTCKKAKFGYIHIFPYSQKSGTVADRWQDIDQSIKKERVHRLEKIRDKMAKKYIKKYIGKTVEMICEDIEDGYLVGYSENYIKVYLSDTKQKGRVKVRLTSLYLEGAKGEIING